MAEAEPKVNSRGYVVLKNKETGAVQEFLPEAVDTWKASGWEIANEKDVEKAADTPGAEVTPAAAVQPPKKEN